MNKHFHKELIKFFTTYNKKRSIFFDVHEIRVDRRPKNR